jgi:hypothetical protein
MAGQAGFFDRDERPKALSSAGDPLERLARVIDFEIFRSDFETARSGGSWLVPPRSASYASKVSQLVGAK